MNAPRIRKWKRLPGEIAFDRCLFLTVATFILQGIWSSIMLRNAQAMARYPMSEPDLVLPPPPAAWQLWLPFLLGLLLAALWCRALASLVRAWNDPSSRVLRFSSSVLLIPPTTAICYLLRTPFQ